MKLLSPITNLIGAGLPWVIQQWLRYTGKSVDTRQSPWLMGPIGKRRIGPAFYENYAKSIGATLVLNDQHAGLIADFDELAGPDFDPALVHHEIHDFYEHTASYSLDVWSEWTGLFQPFAKALIALVSRNMDQLNLPLSPIEMSRGMSNEVIRLLDAQTGQPKYAGWLRRAKSTGNTVYAGFYSVCQPPKASGPCVKVVFPLPKGSTTVILKPQSQSDGSFKLISEQQEFGDAGYYRILEVGKHRLRVKNLPLKEVIHVYKDEEEVLRTDHTFAFYGMKLLTLHYRINPKHLF